MHLKTISQERVGQIRESWLKLLPDNHEVFAAEYHQLFDNIIEAGAWGELDDRFNISIYKAIEDKKDPSKVWALVNIIQSKQGASTWIKLMDIYMSPEIDTNTDNESNAAKRLEVFIAALEGIFSLTKNIRKADTFKIYGRTDLLVAFLRGMHDIFSTINTIGTLKGIDTSIEGRWLVFRPQ